MSTAGGVKFKVPEFLMVNGPLPVVVVIVLLMAKFVPVRLMPDGPVVVTGPLNVVVPLPAVWTMDVAEIFVAVTFLALAIVNTFSGFGEPTAPLRKILPVPAVRVRFCVPLTVEKNVISPMPVPVFNATGPLNATGEAKDILLFAVVILSAMVTLPTPICKKALARFILAPEANVNNPELFMDTCPAPVVVTVPLILNILPARLIPPARLVFNAPLNVVVPVTPVRAIVVAVMAGAVTLFALLMIRWPMRVVPPRMPLKRILPVPAARLN